MSLAAASELLATADESLELYLAVKQGQIARYSEEAKRYDRLSSIAGRYLCGVILLWIPFGIAALRAIWRWLTSANGLPTVTVVFFLIIGVVLVVATIISSRLENAFGRSRVLLEQLVAVLHETIDQSHDSVADLKAAILDIECRFLNNDDELFTKKYLWTNYLAYSHDLVVYGQEKAAYGAAKQRWPHAIFTEPVEPLPHEYVGELSEIHTWMLEDPFAGADSDNDFVYRNWLIKLKSLNLRSIDYWTKYRTLIEINDIAVANPLVFERMLRNKKIRKGLKSFKNWAGVPYLTPAAKLKLATFVDSVLADRPYLPESDSLRELVFEKNAQIDYYCDSFWRIHRRSLRLYGVEAGLALLTIPLVSTTLAIWSNFSGVAAYISFLLGAAALVYGQMALITRQRRDLNAKKLTPSLVSSLIAIRHAMAAEATAEGELTEETTYKYQRAFKAAEKRFMLTVTEVEAVKIAKENISDKVTAKLSPEMLKLRANKEGQARVYYDEFNRYRRYCNWFGALEAFVALLAVPTIVAAVALSLAYTYGIGIQLIAAPIVLGAAIALEVIMVKRHLRVARRKELYLLVYQKMAVLLSDYRLFAHPQYIAAELAKLEDGVVRAAALEGIDDVALHVDAIADVDIAMGNNELWEKMAFLQPHTRHHDKTPDPAVATAIATGASLVESDNAQPDTLVSPALALNADPTAYLQEAMSTVTGVPAPKKVAALHDKQAPLAFPQYAQAPHQNYLPAQFPAQVVAVPQYTFQAPVTSGHYVIAG